MNLRGSDFTFEFEKNPYRKFVQIKLLLELPLKVKLKNPHSLTFSQEYFRDVVLSPEKRTKHSSVYSWKIGSNVMSFVCPVSEREDSIVRASGRQLPTHLLPHRHTKVSNSP